MKQLEQQKFTVEMQPLTPRSSAENAREVARKKEQERRRQEAVSSADVQTETFPFCLMTRIVSMLLWFLLPQMSGFDMTMQWDIMTSFELSLD